MQPKQGQIRPDFTHNIVNISATLQKYLGGKTDKATLPRLAQALQKDYRHIVYLVVDGMGSRILAKNLPADSFLRQHQVQELTSVFPSTTASATTTILSGQYPAEHGWFAWAVDFDGEVIELFRNRNYYTKQPTTPNFAREHLPYPYFFADAKPEFDIHFCMPADINDKPPVANYHAFHNLRQMRRQVCQLCRQDGRKLIYTYFCDLDSVMHQTGTSSAAARRLLRKIEKTVCKLQRTCPDTLFVITADHGQIDVQGEVHLYQDQALMACLAHPISLDPRGASFKIKKGKEQAFTQAFAKYQADFDLYPTQTLIDEGIFGTAVGKKHRALLGDYLAIGKDTAKMLVFSPEQTKTYRGQHTGLTPDEMYVPLILVGRRGE